MSFFITKLRGYYLTLINGLPVAERPVLNLIGAAVGVVDNPAKNRTDVTISAVPLARTIATTAPLTGGGDLSADRTLAISPATSGAAGSMAAADKALLDTTTPNAHDDSVVQRDNLGNIVNKRAGLYDFTGGPGPFLNDGNALEVLESTTPATGDTAQGCVVRVSRWRTWTGAASYTCAMREGALPVGGGLSQWTWVADLGAGIDVLGGIDADGNWAFKGCLAPGSAITTVGQIGVSQTVGWEGRITFKTPLALQIAGAVGELAAPGPPAVTTATLIADKIIELDTTAGVGTVTLPLANTVPYGHIVGVHIFAGANNANLATSGGNTVGKSPVTGAVPTVVVPDVLCLLMSDSANKWLPVNF